MRLSARNQIRRRMVAAALLTILPTAAVWSSPAFCQSIAITQRSEQTNSISAAAVEKLPAVELRVSFQTEHGLEQATYTGALLWAVLEQARSLSSNPRARLHQDVMVTGRDGYVAVLALAEIDPEFEGKQVLLAYQRNGQPIAGELRLVVPGDRRGGRSVRDVVKIEIR